MEHKNLFTYNIACKFINLEINYTKYNLKKIELDYFTKVFRFLITGIETSDNLVFWLPIDRDGNLYLYLSKIKTTNLTIINESNKIYFSDISEFQMIQPSYFNIKLKNGDIRVIKLNIDQTHLAKKLSSLLNDFLKIVKKIIKINKETITSQINLDINIANKKIPESCCVCLDRPKTHVFVPCGHLCICSDCSSKLNSDNCPICQTSYEYCIKTYT